MSKSTQQELMPAEAEISKPTPEIIKPDEPLQMIQAEVGGWRADQNLMVLRPAIELEVALSRLKDFQKLVKRYFVKDVDYGVIPGTGGKPTLYKSGADKFCDVYGLTDTYEIIDAHRDWEKGLFAYEIRCLLHYRGTSVLVSTGLGSCSTWEGKFRWRNATRTCPQCHANAIIKGKEEWGGGWICFKKKDGCGAKFVANDPTIVSQEVGKVENPDIHDQINNVLKSSKKRAKVDAVLAATRSSGLFTQDLEEMPPEQQDEPYGFQITGKLMEMKVKGNGVVALRIGALPPKEGAWLVIGHKEVAKLAASMLPWGIPPTPLTLELDCHQSKSANGDKYIELIRIMKKNGMALTDDAIEMDEGEFVSKCSTHGVYKGEGNCPKCEAE